MLEIETFVENHFDEVKYVGDEIQVNCPQCDDTHGHLYINRDKPVCHCFKCGYSCSWIGLVIDITKVSYHQAIGELNKPIKLSRFNNEISKLTTVEEQPSYHVELPEDFVNLSKANKRVMTTRLALRYLTGRGYGGYHIQKYNLGLAKSVSYRLIIPVEFDYWQGRKLYNWQEPKYINPKADSKRAIFNSSALEMYSEVIVCEGCFSAISSGDNAIALLGKEAPEQKLRRLANSDVRRFVIALDSDANIFAVKLAEKLSRMGKEVEILSYESGDPADNNGVTTRKLYNFRTLIESKLGEKS